jgi:hypothetical protein
MFFSSGMQVEVGGRGVKLRFGGVTGFLLAEASPNTQLWYIYGLLRSCLDGAEHPVALLRTAIPRDIP